MSLENAKIKNDIHIYDIQIDRLKQMEKLIDENLEEDKNNIKDLDSLASTISMIKETYDYICEQDSKIVEMANIVKDHNNNIINIFDDNPQVFDVEKIHSECNKKFSFKVRKIIIFSNL